MFMSSLLQKLLYHYGTNQRCKAIFVDFFVIFANFSGFYVYPDISRRFSSSLPFRRFLRTDDIWN